MGNYNQGRGGSSFGNRGGGRSFGGGGGRGGFGGGRDRGRPEMHKAVCDECGSKCEVPFKPSGDKPVLCSECFGGSDRGNRRDDRGGRDRGRRDDRGERQMHKATCADCGNKCEVPFKPSGDKPVLCSECFGGNRDSGPSKSNQSSEKHDEILAKLDKILTLLQRTNSVKEVTVMKEKKEEEKEEEVVNKFEKKPAKAEPKAKKAPAKKKAATKKTVKKAPAKKKVAAKKK